MVEMAEGLVSRRITNQGMRFVVSTRPFLTGNVGALGDGACVKLVMIGQAPVKVFGPVVANQSLVASGRDDGSARARNRNGAIIAMESSPGSTEPKLINAFISGIDKKPRRTDRLLVNLARGYLARRELGCRTRCSASSTESFDCVVADDFEGSRNSSYLDSDALSLIGHTVQSSDSSVVSTSLHTIMRHNEAMLRGMRLLLRPTASIQIQRVFRGFAGRMRTLRLRVGLARIQTWARSCASKRVVFKRMGASTVMSNAWRCYKAKVSDVGQILRRRRQACLRRQQEQEEQVEQARRIRLVQFYANHDDGGFETDSEPECSPQQQFERDICPSRYCNEKSFCDEVALCQHMNAKHRTDIRFSSSGRWYCNNCGGRGFNSAQGMFNHLNRCHNCFD